MKCSTVACPRYSSLYAQCNPCRAAHCAHLETHYDGGLREVCNACGSEITGPRRKNGQNFKERVLGPAYYHPNMLPPRQKVG